MDFIARKGGSSSTYFFVLSSSSLEALSLGLVVVQVNESSGRACLVSFNHGVLYHTNSY